MQKIFLLFQPTHPVPHTQIPHVEHHEAPPTRIELVIKVQEQAPVQHYPLPITHYPASTPAPIARYPAPVPVPHPMYVPQPAPAPSDSYGVPVSSGYETTGSFGGAQEIYAPNGGYS